MRQLGTWLTMLAGLLLGAGAVSYGLPVMPSTTAAETCVIKGSVRPATGERTYHLPGQKSYSAASTNPQFGERLFCSEDEARAAGWRKAKR